MKRPIGLVLALLLGAVPMLLAQASTLAQKPQDIENLIQKHHAIQRMIALVPARISIPFAERLAERFPAQRPEARRAFPQTSCWLISLRRPRRSTICTVKN